MICKFIKAVLMFGSLSLGLPGCTPPEPIKLGPAIVEPVLSDHAARMPDGGTLAVRLTKAHGPCKAVIIALHGMNDYGTFIADAAEDWARQGIETLAYDQRGFGQSPLVGRWVGEDGLVGDLETLVRLAAARYPGLPLYVLGESMGGAVTMLAASRDQLPGVSGIILSAPAVLGRQALGWFPSLALDLSAALFPGFSPSGHGLGIRPSDNEEALAALSRDPLVLKGTRTDTIYGLVALMDAALARGGTDAVPTLFLYGAKDEIIPKPPIAKLLARYARFHHGAPWRLAYYPDGWHLLTRDRQGPTVAADIAAWIFDQTAPLPSGFERTDRRLPGYSGAP